VRGAPPPRTTTPVRRRALLTALLAALPGCAAAKREGLFSWPFALPDLPGNTVLRPLGGLEIARHELGFGGLSGLHIAPDLTVTVISDIGRFAEMSLALDAALGPLRLALRRTGRLADGAGRPLPRGHASDAEALARLPDGSWLIAYERWHRIRRHATLDAPGSYVEAPPGLERAAANSGLESLAVLADGRWLAIAEELPLPEAPGLTVGWLGGPGAWMPIGWRPAPGMQPVDAAPLPGGGALVLERGFSLFGGFSARLTRIEAAALAEARAGSVLEGEEILRFASPLPVDNYEGVAVVRHQGRLLVGVISDDNENRLQRTLLLLFEMLVE
jgi:hypothetical protein